MSQVIISFRKGKWNSEHEMDINNSMTNFLLKKFFWILEHKSWKSSF